MSDVSEKRKAAERRASEILFGSPDYEPRYRDRQFQDRNGSRVTFNQLVDAILSGERT